MSSFALPPLSLSPLAAPLNSLCGGSEISGEIEWSQRDRKCGLEPHFTLVEEEEESERVGGRTVAVGRSDGRGVGPSNERN